MRAIDTSLLVRLITRGDSAQVLAAESFGEGGAWISHVVLVATVWVLSSVYHFGQAQIVTTVEMLLGHRQWSSRIRKRLSPLLLTIEKKHAPDFSDCLVLELARENGHLPLGSFDRRLGRRDGAQQV